MTGHRLVDGAALGAAALSVGFHLYYVFSGLLPNLVARPIHMAFAILFVFLLGPGRPGAGRVAGWVVGAAGLAACAAVVAFRDTLVEQYGAISGPWQYLLALVLIGCTLEMARRAIKWVMPAVAVAVLAYGLLGQHIPGYFGHAGIPADYFFGTLVVAEGGLWGQLSGITLDTIAPFVILGAFVSAGAAGQGFMTLALQSAGRLRAGAAKVSVLSSALYGMISGSASANTATTGAITIPGMKRLGYPRALAAATEAVASTGGQIMPPIMGAGAFVMAELLRVTYPDIMVAAALPALLFFIAVWWGVHNYAVKHDLRGIEASALPGWRAVGRSFPFFAIPFGILVGTLAFSDYTVAYAAVFATAATWATLMLDAEARPDIRGWAARTALALREAAVQVAQIAAIILCASLIVGVFSMTGLGVKLTSVIVSAAGGELWLALLLTGLAALVLGMELPTTAAYLICIAVAGPALEQLGLPALHAHLFVFWYALLCTITPPVCGNVFIAAGIAETPWLPVAWTAMRLGVGLFVVPLGFIYNPAMLHLAEMPVLALLAAAKVGGGIWLLSFAVINPLRRPVLCLAAGAAGLLLVFLGGIG
ncbi:MAG: TRAP transporter permease [Thalassobaculales bacterium]